MKPRPLLRYHGGKWMLAPWIIEHFPAHRIYVEPFGGGGSVLLRKARSYAEVYNEMDGEITNLFAVVRDSGKELVSMLETTPFSRIEFLQSYQPSADPLERARRTLTRSFMGFGSPSACGHKTGFRANSNRSGTTPAHDWRNYPECLVHSIERLRGVVIENRDASQVMVAHDSPETLHYVDPPYLPDTRGTPDKGYRFEMTQAEHEQLGATLNRLTGAVVISGYPHPLYDNMFASWRRVERAALADGARKRTEVLWIKSAAPSGSQYV